MVTATADRTEQPLASAKPKALLGLTAGELAIRFVCGALASIAAGLVAHRYGIRTGGIFLALPAIFVASITLEERKGSRDDMQHQVSGAPLGALGMVVFALVVVALVDRLHLAVVLTLATLAWAAVAATLYLVVELFRRRHSSDDSR